MANPIRRLISGASTPSRQHDPGQEVHRL
jgi:hypothetical protein